EVRTAIPGGTAGAPAVTRVTTTENDDWEAGIQQRRLQLNFQGNVISPKWTYRARLAADAEGGTARVDYAYVGYQVTPEINVIAGQFKGPFLREEMVG